MSSLVENPAVHWLLEHMQLERPATYNKLFRQEIHFF